MKKADYPKCLKCGRIFTKEELIPEIMEEQKITIERLILGGGA